MESGILPPKSPKISCKMKQLTVVQRYTIECLLAQGQSKTKIAQAIGVATSTVCREIKRNCDQRNGVYKSGLAQRKCQARHQQKPKLMRFTEQVIGRAEALLLSDFSPEQVVGYCQKKQEPMVSHETIYQYIWKDKKAGGNLHQHLRHQGRKYRKRGAYKDSRGIITNRVDIQQRPDIVARKKRFGDLEVDTIIGKNHQGAIVTLNDRATGMLKMKKVNTREASLVEKAIVDLVQDWKPFGLHTMTADNGKEFANHQSISETTGINIYFAKPYHSWQRGANENLNGLVRQYLPKQTDFSSVSDEQVQAIENKLNERPRKRYNYRSPIEQMEQVLFTNSVAFIS